MGNIFSELFTMTHQSWMALHSMADSYTELWKHLKHDKAMIREGNIEFTIFKENNYVPFHPLEYTWSLYIIVLCIAKFHLLILSKILHLYSCGMRISTVVCLYLSHFAIR